MSALNAFNRVAHYYDFLKWIIFGTSIDDCQEYFLPALPDWGNILIVGGGSGVMLADLLAIRPSCSIWYLEASSEMIEKADARVGADARHRVVFVHGTNDELPAGIRFDGVITNFFLDLFPDDTLHEICNKIGRQLNPGGVWLVSDFVDAGRWWQRLLLRVMYRFFVIACDIDARKLPAWGDYFRASGFETEESKFFYKGFIKSSVYRKPAL